MEISAAVSRSSDQFAIETVELEKPRDDEVLVRVTAAGVCHSDIHFSRTFGRPSVLGHEGSGIIAKIGADVRGFAIGDRVIMSFNSCGTCAACRSGHPAVCENFSQYNTSGTRPDGSYTTRDRDGNPIDASIFGQSSFATHSLAYDRNLVKVPDDTPEELLPLLGPLGCGVQTGAGAVLNVLKPDPDDLVVIAGAGGVGLSALLGALVLGVSRIAVVDVNAGRLALAQELGATHVINGRDCDDLATALTRDGGGAPKYGLDTTGSLGVITALAQAIGQAGTLALLAMGTTRASFLEQHPEISAATHAMGILEGDAIPQSFIPEMLRLHLDGRLPFDKLVRTYPFADIQRAVADSISGASVKPVLIM